MAIEFKLPEVSEGVTSVDVAEILVKEGDVIESGATICEVETDKAVAEIPCPHAGTVQKILVSAGQSVEIGTPLIMIDTDGGDAGAGTASESAPSDDSAADDQSAAPDTTSGEAPSEAAAESAADTSSPGDGGEATEETIEFCLPDVSEGIESVDVASVAVKPGDTITADSVICEVETDKAVADIPCPHAGTIETVHVTAGDTISVGDPLVTIRTSGSGGAAGKAGSGKSTAGGRESSQGPGDSASSAAAKDKSQRASQTSKAPAASAQPSATKSSRDDRPPAPAGPATRRLARKLGVDLYEVGGTARGGRITIEDVEAWVRERLASGVPAAADRPGIGAVTAAPLPDFSKFGPIEKQSLNKIYRTAAANLHAAWVTIPHVTQHDLADITELEAARKRYVKSNPNAPKITMTAIMIKAVVAALKAYPNFNASIDVEAGELIVKQYYHIGVAVDTPMGLVVPVIRNCDQKNVLQVAAELTDLAARGRDRKLKTEDLQGASFTITNLGGIGGTAFTPIVNHPEVAILGMSRGQTQLVLEDSMVAERLVLPLSLSYDHRAVNGADAARFIVKLSSSLSNFFELF